MNEQARKWQRFSLRTLFILTTLVCLFFGIWAAYVNPYRVQQQSLAVVNQLQGATGKAPGEGAGWQRWLVTTFLGKDAYQQVTEVDLNGKQVNDETLRALRGLVFLRKLSLDYTTVSDASIPTLRVMPKLQTVSLRYTGLTDQGVASLATLPELHCAYLTGTKITDSAVPELAKVGSLHELYIRWTGITNDGADKLAAALPDCDVYHHALSTD